MGRFISEDPKGLNGGDVNLFAYASNNPIMLIDPLGLCPECQKIADAVNAGLSALGLPQSQGNIYPLYKDFAGVKDAGFTNGWAAAYSIHGVAHESSTIPGVEPPLDIKYYNDPVQGQIIAPVAPTNSWRHYPDALEWSLGGNPNLRHANQIMGQ